MSVQLPRGRVLIFPGYPYSRRGGGFLEVRHSSVSPSGGPVAISGSVAQKPIETATLVLGRQTSRGGRLGKRSCSDQCVQLFFTVQLFLLSVIVATGQNRAALRSAAPDRSCDDNRQTDTAGRILLECDEVAWNKCNRDGNSEAFLGLQIIEALK